MLFNSYSPGVLVSPKLHPLGEAAWISQFLASRVCQQQMFPAKGGYKTGPRDAGTHGRRRCRAFP